MINAYFPLMQTFEYEFSCASKLKTYKPHTRRSTSSHKKNNIAQQPPRSLRERRLSGGTMLPRRALGLALLSLSLTLGQCSRFTTSARPWSTRGRRQSGEVTRNIFFLLRYRTNCNNTHTIMSCGENLVSRHAECRWAFRWEHSGIGLAAAEYWLEPSFLVQRYPTTARVICKRCFEACVALSGGVVDDQTVKRDGLGVPS